MTIHATATNSDRPLRIPNSGALADTTGGKQARPTGGKV